MSKDIIQLNEEVVKNELKELVRNSVDKKFYNMCERLKRPQNRQNGAESLT